MSDDILKIKIKTFLKDKKILLEKLLIENEKLRNQIKLDLSPLSFTKIEEKTDFKQKVKQTIKLLNERIEIVIKENNRIQELKELLKENKKLRHDKLKHLKKKLEPLEFTDNLKHNLSILKKQNKELSKYTDYIQKNIEAVRSK
jgi:hypothetical protein